MSYRSGQYSEYPQQHSHSHGRTAPRRGIAAHGATAPAPAASSQTGYTLVHAGKQVRVGPVVFWIVVGAVTGAMPGWAGGLAGILIPASGVANFTAVDMCSRHMPWAIVFPVLLAPLIAFYAFWMGWKRLHAALPAERTSVAVWASVFVLSVATFVLAA